MARILVAFDGSDGAIGAVTALSHWSFQQSTEIVLLTVTVPGEWPTHHVSRSRELAARSLRRHGATVHTMIREGDPVEEILSVARDRDVDLIALGPRKQAALSVLLLGSVTRDIMHRCGCSIFIGRLSLSTERAILALSNREDATLLTRRWQELPLPSNLELILLGVGSEFPAPSHVPARSLRHGSPEKLPSLAQAEERDRVWRLVENTRREMAPFTHTILAEVVLGGQVDEILRLERRTSPELLVVRNTGLQDRLVAEARSSVLLL
jgi:nucleotide-binding universal stress UspA family protein